MKTYLSYLRYYFKYAVFFLSRLHKSIRINTPKIKIEIKRQYRVDDYGLFRDYLPIVQYIRPTKREQALHVFFNPHPKSCALSPSAPEGYDLVQTAQGSVYVRRHNYVSPSGEFLPGIIKK